MKFKPNHHLLFCLLVASVTALPVQSSTPDDDDEFDWFEEDFESRAREVNEGELAFLAEPPEKPVHHHQNTITVLAESLQHGWVKLQQCHTNIDNVGRAQILFRKGKIRNLQITRSSNIDEAWVEGPSVQLKNITRDSSLCIEAETKALTANDDGSYRINNGPYMRRFLDGYYPMRVTVQISLANSGLRFDSITPEHQPGFSVENSRESIRFDAWFEGQLRTEVRFQVTNPSLASR